MAKNSKGPKFVQFFGSVLQALRDLGGSARPGEVVDRVAEIKKVSEKEQQELLASGQTRFYNQIAFARQYLIWAGLLDSPKHGVWTLTEKGWKTDLSDEDAVAIFREQHKLHQYAEEVNGPSSDDEGTKEAADENPVDDYKEPLLIILRSLPPAGFERLCQRLLRESGFEHVTVTGRSGDGGIDGIGVVKVNPFVTFKVLFQCKRYSKTVGPGHVRDFRGALQGRADKGIIITTGSFSSDAKKEAVRDGVPPIELVDGLQLIQLFEEFGLGLKPRTTYDIDLSFFDPFKEE